MSPESSNPVACANCGSPLPWQACNSPGPVPCAVCGAPTHARLYPAILHRLETGSRGEPVTVPTDAVCFYHEGKKASAVCDACGRFLCGLCAVDMDDGVYCSQCISSRQRSSKPGKLRARSFMYDNVALLLCAAPLAMGWLGLLVAPVVLVYVVRYWRTVDTPLPRTQIRFVVAVLIALAEIALIIGLVNTMIMPVLSW
ncbi:MAG: hypothetical protein R6V03_05755 [Kiritimatiellia bacterium]